MILPKSHFFIDKLNFNMVAYVSKTNHMCFYLDNILSSVSSFIIVFSASHIVLPHCSFQHQQLLLSLSLLKVCSLFLACLPSNSDPSRADGVYHHILVAVWKCPSACDSWCGLTGHLFVPKGRWWWENSLFCSLSHPEKSIALLSVKDWHSSFCSTENNISWLFHFLFGNKIPWINWASPLSRICST